MDCSNPVIAENELFGSWLAVPWSATNAQYRANVLLFLQTLRAARRATVAARQREAVHRRATAGDWWRQVADVAGIVREVYFPAPLIYKQGPICGNRTLRQAFRNGILDFTKSGNPGLEARDLPRLPDDEGQRRPRRVSRRRPGSGP